MREGGNIAGDTDPILTKARNTFHSSHDLLFQVAILWIKQTLLEQGDVSYIELELTNRMQ